MIEREIKLAAEAGIVLPDLTDARPGITVGPTTTLQLDAIYYDTPTLSLARWGVTLRARSGEAGPIWTLKLPVTSHDSELSRHEFTFDEPMGPVPEAVFRATRAYVRSQVLGPVVRLQTERIQFVVALVGQPIATVCDDTVVVDAAAEPVSMFREVEVELTDTSSAEAVEAIVERLRSAGCRDDEAPVPKVVRALGPRAFEAPDVVISKVRKHATVGLLVRHTLSKSVTQLIGQHAKVCAGDDCEAVRQFRATVRRLRSDLRTFAPLLAEDSTTWLGDELGWLESEVGIVGDADLLAERLRSRLPRVPDQDAKYVGTLSRHLTAVRKDAFEHVVATLAADRYVALLDSLVDVARAPRLAAEPPGLADRSGRPIFIDIAREAWRSLSRAVDALAPDTPDDAYHALSDLSQRARYVDRNGGTLERQGCPAVRPSPRRRSIRAQ